MGMNRQTLLQIMETTYQNELTSDFMIVVPEHDMPAVLSLLKHLIGAGRLTSFSRRNAQNREERDDVVDIVGYVPEE